MPLVTGDRVDIFTLNKTKLIEELKIIKEDLMKLGQAKIVIADLKEANFMCNGQLYFVDSGEYYESVDQSDTTAANIYLTNLFFTGNILYNDLIQKTCYDKYLSAEMAKKNISRKEDSTRR